MATKITNTFNLPTALVEAAKVSMPIVAGDISASQLIEAPQIRMLRRKHDVEIDVTERVPAMIGTALHEVLRRSHITDVNRHILKEASELLTRTNLKEKNEQVKGAAEWLLKYADQKFPEKEQEYLYEFTLHAAVDGMVIYHTMDNYHIKDGVLYDYKFCSVYDFMIPEARKKWYAELNVGAYLLRENGLAVNKIQVIAIFKDFSRTKAGFERDYPEAGIITVDIPIVSMSEMSKYLAERVKLHRQAEQGNIPDCTGKDKWAKADEWAARQPNAKKALKRFMIEADAHKWIADNAKKYPGLFVETRKGEALRCEKYCSVRNVCEQRKREQGLTANQNKE